MIKSKFDAALPGDVLSFQPWTLTPAQALAEHATEKSSHVYLLQVHGDAMPRVLEAVMPMLDHVLSHKTAEIRAQKLQALVDFIVGQLVVPSRVDTQMAQRLAVRHAGVLNEFGFATAEQLADANQSRAANRTALTDNWKKRGQVFAVRHCDASGRPQEVFPLFQFEDHKPIKAVQAVLESFGTHKAPWKLALWFTSHNGWLPGQARPVDLLGSNPAAVLQAAQRDAAGPAT